MGGVFYAKYGMSEAAVRAYWDGRRPASRVRAEHLKEAGIDLTVKEWRTLCRTGFIQPSEWHHTGAVGNETNFYDLNDPDLKDPKWITEARAAIGTTKRVRHRRIGLRRTNAQTGVNQLPLFDSK